MKTYNNDPIKYYKEEWGCSNDGELAAPEQNQDDLTEFDAVETQFMKQFFSIKAYP